MCSDTKSNLESIEDFVVDQDKIVTYKWLSKKLNIHTNTAKQLLYTFSINSNENLLVTYLVSGSDPDGIKVYLVNQSEVDRVKSNLDTVQFEHVYSVQKANSTVSSVDLYNADSSAQKCDKNISSISQRKIEKREFQIVTPAISSTVSKPGHQTTSSKPVQKEAARPSFFKGKPSESLNKKKDDNSASHVSNKEAQLVKHGKSPVKSHVVSPTKHNQKKISQSKGSNIGALFSKQSARNAEKKKNEPVVRETKTEEPKEVEGPKSLTEDVQVSDDEELLREMSISTEKTVLKTPVASKKSAKSRNKRKLKREDDTSVKRRKRIVLASASESSGEEEEADMDFEEEPQPDFGETSTRQIPESDDDEIIPPTPFGERAKKRIRKQVDRTFTDDDGFVITEKQFVYESCSDNDEKTDSKENVQNKCVEKTVTETTVKDNEMSRKDEPDSHTDQTSTKVKKNQPKSKQTKNSLPGKDAKKSPKKGSSKTLNNQKSITFFFKKN